MNNLKMKYFTKTSHRVSESVEEKFPQELCQVNSWNSLPCPPPKGVCVLIFTYH